MRYIIEKSNSKLYKLTIIRKQKEYIKRNVVYVNNDDLHNKEALKFTLYVLTNLSKHECVYLAEDINRYV